MSRSFCNILHHTTTHCNTTHCTLRQFNNAERNMLRFQVLSPCPPCPSHSATHYTTLHHTATHCTAPCANLMAQSATRFDFEVLSPCPPCPSQSSCLPHSHPHAFQKFPPVIPPDRCMHRFFEYFYTHNSLLWSICRCKLRFIR